MARIRVILRTAVAVGLVAGLGNDSHAKSIEIQFFGLDLVYDGSNIYDATSELGRDGDHSEADPLTSMTFLVDGQVQGVLTEDIAADVRISGVTGIPVGGGFLTSGGNGDTFGFDILTSPTGWGLSLNLDKVEIYYSGNQIAIGGGAAASSVFYQRLPFDLKIDDADPVTLSFSSASLGAVTDNGTFLTGFEASGTGNINAFSAPEPSAAVLLLLGAAGVLIHVRRRCR